MQGYVDCNIQPAKHVNLSVTGSINNCNVVVIWLFIIQIQSKKKCLRKRYFRKEFKLKLSHKYIYILS